MVRGSYILLNEMKLGAKWRSNVSVTSIEKDTHVLCMVLPNCPDGVEASHVVNEYDLESSVTKDVSYKIFPFFQSVISTVSAYRRIYSGAIYILNSSVKS